MPNVLIVEDDEFKCDNINLHLQTLNPTPTVTISRSVSQAINFVGMQAFDLIVLDMSLPSHPITQGGGSPFSMLVGGLEVLFELQSLGRRDACIILTQFYEIEICEIFYPLKKASKAIQEKYGVKVYGCIPYSEDGSVWKSLITTTYKQLCAS